MFAARSPKIYIPLAILVAACLLTQLFPNTRIILDTIKLSNASLFALNTSFWLSSWVYNASSSNLRRLSPKIRTSSGLVEGHSAPSRPAVAEFLGIPFAQSPVGPLRFAAPQPYRARGPFRASSFVWSNLPYPSG